MAQRGNNIPYEFIAFPVDIFTANTPLTRSELMLLAYLLMQVRFGKEVPALTDDDLLNGVRRADGTREDNGCGIGGGNNFKKAREGLVARGWLEVKQINRYVRTYKPILEVFATIRNGQSASETDSQGTTRLSETDSATIRNGQSNEPTNNVLRLKERKKKGDDQQGELIALPKKAEIVIPRPPLPVWMPVELWNGWMEVRRKKRAPFSDLGYRLALDEFEIWRSQGYDVADMLRTAIKRNWIAIELDWYLNTKGKSAALKPPPPPDGYALAMEGRKR